jgi:hypothetical protein
MSIVDHMTRDQLLQMQSSARLFQARYDSALEPWDQRAPAPVLGETVDDYRRGTLVKMKKLLPENHKLRIPVRKMPNDVLDVFDPQICKAVRDAAYRPDSVPRGELRRVVKVDGNGSKMVEWVGQESFVKQMGRPGRKVVSFMHRYNTSGVAFR